MKKLQVNRLYNFADSHLITMGRTKIGFMRRDITEFLSFGITELMITGLEEKIDVFSNGVTDIEELGEQAEVTEVKTMKAEEIRVAIRNVMGRVELKYPSHTARYKRFGVGAISQLSDSDLLITAKRVARVATEFLSDLTVYGLEAEMLTEIFDMCEEFEMMMMELQMKISDRDIVQEDRVEAGNAIYSTLVSYVATGRLIWETRDVAKCNDYVIYDTVTSSVPEPEVE